MGKSIIALSEEEALKKAEEQLEAHLDRLFAERMANIINRVQELPFQPPS
jgi:Mn-dependent DtxR family transcriptional regulator